MRKTIVFTGQEKLEIREDAIPQPGSGELLVQTTCTLISSGTEMIVFTRNFSPGTSWSGWVKYPFLPGYLHTGRVSALGEGVEGWQVGDRVASRSNHSSHVLVPVSKAVRIPDAVSDEDATWMGLGQITQIGARAAAPQIGDSVVVIGLGLLGQLIVQYARMMGARDVIAIDTSPLRLAMADSHGATQVLAMPAEVAIDALRDLTHGHGADTVYDVTGHPAAFAASLQLARRFGTVILMGDTGTPEQQHLTGDVLNRGVRIVGAHDTHPPEVPHELARWSKREMQELFLTFLARGQMQVNNLITHRFPFAKAERAYALLGHERDKAMGVMVTWELDG